MNGKLVAIAIEEQLHYVTSEGFTPDPTPSRTTKSTEPCHCGSERPYRLCHHPNAKEKLMKIRDHEKKMAELRANDKQPNVFVRALVMISRPFKAIWSGTRSVGTWIKNMTIRSYNGIKTAVIWMKTKTVSAFSWTKDKTVRGYTTSKEWAQQRYNNVRSFFKREKKSDETAQQNTVVTA